MQKGNGYKLSMVVLMVTLLTSIPSMVSGSFDEPHPYVGASGQSLLQRLADLEKRVDVLEKMAGGVEGRKVLEVITMQNCGPCRQFEADLRSVGDETVEVKYVETFAGDPRLRPAFRWRLKDNTFAIKSGYNPGTIESLLSAVRRQER